MLERRCRELEPFDGREHGDRRCNHGVADEHRSADDAERHQHPAPLSAECPLTQRHQRQRAALAVVVGAQQQQHVF
jgi:hypothetical protein